MLREAIDGEMMPGNVGLANRKDATREQDELNVCSLGIQSLVRRSGLGLRRLFIRFKKPPPPGLSFDSS